MEPDIRCTYAAILGLQCDCSYSYFNDCPNYRKFRRHFLLKEIKPINLKTEEFEKTEPFDFGTAIYSRTEGPLKTQAAITSIKKNLKVKKLTFSQVVSASLESIDIDDEIIFVEAASCTIDLVKGRQVLVSFVDKMTLINKIVFVFSKIPSFVCEDNWVKL